MEKNLVKTLLKAVITTAMAAMVGTLFIGGSKMNAQACEKCDAERAAFAASKGVTVEVMMADDDLRSEYFSWKIESAYGSAEAFLDSIAVTDITAVHPEMLAYVNADRAVYGANAVVWDDELAAYAKQRAVEVMNNFQSPEFAAAYATGGDYTSIAHKGIRSTTGENAVMDNGNFGTGTADKYNNAWIVSPSHHANRITNGFTKYACASYVDSFTGDTVWVELFEYGTPGIDNASFDYMRYANENPDVAAVFGQNSTALYNHYITCGAVEGRKAYYINGTQIK